jgi:O-antigen ligase/tetratricopeptide (TPR) repeat protein
MSRKHPAKENTAPQQAPTPSSKISGRPLQAGKIIPLFFCLAYLCVHFLSDLGAYDAMAPQWMLVLGVDFIAVVYILANKPKFDTAINTIFNNIFSKLYLAFFLLAGISVFFAINATETWVCYVRLIATVIAFFCLAVFFYGRTGIFNWVAQLISLVFLIEALIAFSGFFREMGQISMNELILNIKNTTGNKNIFAASMITKLPFVLYCIHTGALWKKILNLAILFLGVLIILLANARASYLSLIVITILYLSFCVFEYRKEKKTDQLLYRFGYIIIPLIAAFFVSQIEISNVKSLEENKGTAAYGSVTERLGTVADFSDIRLKLWGHAIDYTTKHPFMGCGYGNWKLASIPYVRTLTDDLFVPIHPHNDFLEMFAELGIAGGLLYLSLFVCITLFTWKTFFSNASQEIKLASLFSFLAFVGYSIDAFFNFPMERPVNQVFFALLSAINIGAFMEARKDGATNTKSSALLLPAFGLISLLVSIPSVYVMYYNYKSLIIQRKIIPDLNNEPLQLKYQEIFPLIPSIPNISASAQPLNAIKGRYLSEAGKYDEALVLLNGAIAANPMIGYSQFLKAVIYYKTNKLDSASINALEAFDYRPRAKTYYQTLMAVLSVTKDSVRIQKSFEEYIKYRDQPFGYDMYIRAMLHAKGKGTQPLLDTVDHALLKFPKDSILTARRREIVGLMGGVSGVTNNSAAVNAALQAKAQAYYNEAVAAFAKGQAGNKQEYQHAANAFVKAGEIITSNYVIYENAGIAYFNMGEFKKAITYFDKAIALGTAVDGKSYYFKGVAQYNTGKTAEGCNTMRIASSKGYKEADAILKANCK